MANSSDTAILDCPPQPRLVFHIGVTGHRYDDLQGRNLDAIRKTVAAIIARLREAVAGIHSAHGGVFDPRPPIFRVFSRLADGADLIVADEAVKQGFAVHCPLPFSRADYATCINASWKPLYETLLDGAAHVLELDGDGATAATRDESFYESRRMVLRHSDVLIAIWDPEDHPSQVWGTTRLVTEARHDDLLVIHIDPGAPAEPHLDVRHEDADVHTVPIDELEGRVRALVAPPPPRPLPSQGNALGRLVRACMPKPPHEAFLAERQPRWTLGVSWLLFRELVHKARVHFPHFRVKSFAPEAAGNWASGWTAGPILPPGVRERIDNLLFVPFAWADALGDYYANLTRSFILLNYLLAAAAVFLALVGHNLGWQWNAIELGIIVVIISTTLYANYRRWHERWMDYRVLAERIRLQRYLAPLGRITPHTRRPAHLSFGDIRGSWVAWYFRSVVREPGLVAERFDPLYVEAAAAAVTKLLAEPKDGQIIWHDTNAKRFHAIETRLEYTGLTLFALTGFACAAHLYEHHWEWLTLITAGFPALGAAFAAIAIHLQLDRVAKHSHSMHERLTHLQAYLQRQYGPQRPALSHNVSVPLEEIAECMTSEVLDWRTLFRGRIGVPS